LQKIYETIIGDDGHQFRSDEQTSQETQDKLAGDFVQSKEKVGHDFISSAIYFPYKIYLDLVVFSLNLDIQLINLFLPRRFEHKKLSLIKKRFWKSKKRLKREAASRKKELAYEMLKSGKVTSGRAQLLLATAVDKKHAKELLLEGTVTGEKASVQLAEMIDNRSDARELMESRMLFHERVRLLLKEKEGLSPALPPAPKDRK
jgi:hypothetical protein